MSVPPGSVCIVGGGPAGMVAGYLFARAGVRTTVLEKHADFLRDFRGDTVHPSTLEIFYELGLDEKLLAGPHDAVTSVGARIGGRDYKVADFSHLPVAHPFIAMMPQWEFLDFLSAEAARLPAFSLRRECEATGLVEAGTRVAGVRLASGESVAADLVIAADGRGSVLRDAGGLPRHDLGAPIDVFWFRVPKVDRPGNDTQGIVAPGTFLVLIDRGVYWQCGYVLAKGGADRVRDAGLDAFRARLRAAAPELADGIDSVASWDDVKLLSVSLDRLTRWHRPGLLAIGDAAHAMSPVGGVGINLAVQDAVAAANLLAGPLARGQPVDPLLGGVQARRMPAVRVVQAMQRTIHRRVLAPTLAASGAAIRAPAIVKVIDALPLLQRLPGRIIGLGVRRERVRSPAGPLMQPS